MLIQLRTQRIARRARLGGGCLLDHGCPARLLVGRQPLGAAVQRRHGIELILVEQEGPLQVAAPRDDRLGVFDFEARRVDVGAAPDEVATQFGQGNVKAVEAPETAVAPASSQDGEPRRQRKQHQDGEQRNVHSDWCKKGAGRRPRRYGVRRGPSRRRVQNTLRTAMRFPPWQTERGIKTAGQALGERHNTFSR
jgi:DMSO/TMAO reductase YedYZ molybdopterin-dependent catalytic subunit